MKRKYKKSPSLYFFTRRWNSINPANLEIVEKDKERSEITYTVRGNAISVKVRKNSLLYKEIKGRKDRYEANRRLTVLLNEPDYCPKAEKKAKELLKKTIKKIPIIEYREGKITVKSRNERTYEIKNVVFEVGEGKREFKCVDVQNNRLPPADKALAKALVVGYRPELIYTLSETESFNDL